MLEDFIVAIADINQLTFKVHVTTNAPDVGIISLLSWAGGLFWKPRSLSLSIKLHHFHMHTCTVVT